MKPEFVLVDGQYYSVKHPKALALQRGQPPEATPPEHELPSSQSGLRVAKRIRQNSKPLTNELETEFLQNITDILSDYAIENLSVQAKRYKLGNGIWYKPDFVFKAHDRETAVEVKGKHAFRGGFENLKVAAYLWPDVRWILAWKEEGEWLTQIVLK